MAGKVRIFCFDKTGTLTKEGLEFFGLHPLASVFGAGGAPQFAPARLNTAVAAPYLLQAALATCHAVTTVGDQHVGNPVDVEQFHASGWRLADKQQPDCHARSPPLPYTCLDTLIAPHSDGEKPRALHVVKRFEFAHARQSMSVATLDPATNHVHMFIKGSFERIKQVSDPHSIPADFDAVTSSWAKEGCYVLAIAHKDLGPVQDWDKLEATGRDEFESGCSFVSLLLFRNQLKEDTADALAELRGGDIRTVMITGDNALTGVYVAKQCGMAPADTSVILGDLERLPRGEKASADASIVWRDTATDAIVPDIDVLLSQQGDRFGAKPGADEAMPAVELAVTAAAFERLVETGRIRDYLLDIRIFARMAPADKVQAVQLFMERGVTGMCGDGGNDCGALRAAHVGIALSEAEASIVSPFSTPIRTIYSCVNLVRQGRCAITTSFTTFKFLIMYGETMAWLQLFSFYFSVVITQPTWIFIDAFVTVGMTLTLSMARPARRLAPSRPTAKLLGSQTLASLVGQVIINFVFLVGMMGILFRQSWYRCHEFDSRDIDLAKWQLLGDNYEAEVIEVLMLFQMVNAAGTFNFGHLYRQSWWRNYAFIIIFCLYLALVSAMGLTNPNRLNCLFRINCGDPNMLVRMGYPRPTWHITPYNSPIGNNVMPMRFRWLLWGYSIANAAAVYIYEFFVVLGPVGQWVKRRWRQHFGSDGLQVKL
ncbi:hypothetical protein EV182_003377 [Spiromyces aspiralis]|uniref:Uncharacterized protein n=1 Tax=Spiromyces aspiralis TaxID=68401 RepID=A0ACC1HDW9_9FUNG|nr:hypothetical protein EV182_003377 [Spiromyces aspiralis]